MAASIPVTGGASLYVTERVSTLLGVLDHSFPPMGPSSRETTYPECAFPFPLPVPKTSFSVMSTPQVHLWEEGGRDLSRSNSACARAATSSDRFFIAVFLVPRPVHCHLKPLAQLEAP